MKKSEIKVGGEYIAKVSGKLTTVRVDCTRNFCNAQGGESTKYFVTNLATEKKLTFSSAAKFRREAKELFQKSPLEDHLQKETTVAPTLSYKPVQARVRPPRW